MAFVEAFYEKDDYGFDEYLLSDGNFCQAALYAEMGENEKAMDALEKMLGHIERYDAYCNKRACAVRDTASGQIDTEGASLLTRRIGSDQLDQQNYFAPVESSAVKQRKNIVKQRKNGRELIPLRKNSELRKKP